MAKEFCSCEEIQMMFEKILAILEQTGGPVGVVPMERKKRAPSERAVFIGHCMKGGGKTMKECSDEYKTKKVQ